MAYDLTLPNPAFHVILRDENGNKVGLTAVDARGNTDALTIVRTPVERSSLKTSTGNQAYSDLEPPYTVLAQDEWSGGRGGRVYEEDVTRFYNSRRAETGRSGKIILNGRETYGTGYRNANTSLPGSMKMIPLAGSQRYLAVKFTANASYTVDKIALWVAAYGSPAGNFTVRLREDNAGNPGTVLQTTTITAASLETAVLSELYPFNITDQAITSAALYWVEIYAADYDTTTGNYWKVGVSQVAGTTKQSTNGSTWAASTYDLYYRILDNTAQMDGRFFKYKRALYYITMPTDGSASLLWMNGVRGVAKSNAGDLTKTLVNGASPEYTVNEFIGCVLLIIGGTGSEEIQNWRTITANAADSFTHDSPWLIQHDTTTEFVVLGSNRWQQITMSDITKTVTDVMVATSMVVFCQGEAANFVGMKEEQSAGAWTRTTAVAATKGFYMRMFNNAGTMTWVRSNGNTTVSAATEPAWGAAPTWGTQKAVGFAWEKITGLTTYASDSGTESIWVMKESGPWEFDGTTVTSKSRDEMKAIMSRQLGKVSAKSDVYLWISVMNTVWRYYSPTFDDVGFMLEDGLPTEMRGDVSCILPYPGRTLFSVNAGTGYSCILENNGSSSYHEKYCAPKGEKIYHMEIQVIPGTALDKLWIRQGADFLWIPYPSNAFDPKQDALYPYVHEGAVELGAMYAGLQDAWKYWSNLKMQLEDLTADTTWVEADYRLDDGAWVAMPASFTEMPMDEQAFGDVDASGRTFGVSSKKFQLRLRLISTSSLLSPVVRAVIIEAVTVNQPKFSYSFVYHIGIRDLNGKPDATLTAGEKTALVTLGVEDTTGDFGDVMTPSQKQKMLDIWSGTAQPLWMECIIPTYHNRPVFLAPPPARPLTISEQENEFTYTNSIVLQEA